jgi:hypothetical protein
MNTGVVEPASRDDDFAGVGNQPEPFSRSMTKGCNKVDISGESLADSTKRGIIYV